MIKIGICILMKETFEEFILSLQERKFSEKQEKSPDDVAKMETMAKMGSHARGAYLS